MQKLLEFDFANVIYWVQDYLFQSDLYFWYVSLSCNASTLISLSSPYHKNIRNTMQHHAYRSKMLQKKKKKESYKLVILF